MDVGGDNIVVKVTVIYLLLDLCSQTQKEPKSQFQSMIYQKKDILYGINISVSICLCVLTKGTNIDAYCIINIHV